MVFILTLRDSNEKLLKNLGVSQTKSSGQLFLQNLRKANPSMLVGGGYKLSMDDLRSREQDIGYNPATLLIYENDFYKVYAEKSNLY